MHEKVHIIIDPESMCSTNRLVTLEFLEIVSEQEHPDGAFRSLFTKGYTYRRRGVPELLKIMHRSQFLDMRSKLSVASRGNLGGDAERQHCNLGQLLYKTILKYMFEGMGLTPGARFVIQPSRGGTPHWLLHAWSQTL